MHDDRETWFYLDEARAIGAYFAVSVELLRHMPEAAHMIDSQRTSAIVAAEHKIMDAVASLKWDGIVTMWGPWIDPDMTQVDNAFFTALTLDYRRYGTIYHAPRVRSVEVVPVLHPPRIVRSLVDGAIVETVMQPMASTQWRTGVGGVLPGGVLLVNVKE